MIAAIRLAGLVRLVGLAGLAVALLLTACAPRLAPPGPGLASSGLSGQQIIGTEVVTRDGLSLPMRRWLPEGEPKAVILALHGFNDYSKAFEEPGNFWRRQGIATFAYDQRGFGSAPHRGLWAGSAAMVDDLRVAVLALRVRYPGVPLYLLGDSMGGAVILTAMTGTNPPKADGVILAAPAVWARSTMGFGQKATLWIGAHTIPWVTLTGRGLKIQASDNIEMLRALGRDPLVIKKTRIDALHGLVDLMDQALAGAPKLRGRALLLYGEKDQVVPKDPTFRLWRSLPSSESADSGSAAPSQSQLNQSQQSQQSQQRQALYSNGWHMLLRDLDATRVLGDVAYWVLDGGGPLPSGADTHARAVLQRDQRGEKAASD